MSRRFHVFLGTSMMLAFLCGSVAASSAAQTPTGTITGRVTLASTDDPVHGATVIVIGARDTVTTGEDGRFTVPNVPPGTYAVIAQRQHLSAVRQEAVVTAGGTTTVDFELTLEATHEEVTVTASATGAGTAFDSFNAVTTLDSTEIARNAGAGIGEVLQNEPGVSMRSFGPGASRPIIRGFDGDRVLIMQDGLRTGDLSSQSGDHGVSIDPGGLERLEVVKGPATLLYGSNAIGGVVNAITPQDAFRTSPFDGVLGGITLDTGTVNDQVGGHGSLQWGRSGWTVWGSGGSRRSGDYEAPGLVVENSASSLGTARAGMGWVGTRAFFGIGGQLERSRFGIPFAGEFHEHDHGDDADSENEEEPHLDIDLDADRREVRLDTGLRDMGQPFLENLKITLAAIRYRHDELEIENGIEAVGTSLENETNSLRVELEQDRQRRLSGRLGLEWFGRDFSASGEEALAPATFQTAFSVFAYEELGFDRFRLQFGGRLERNGYDVSAREIDSEGEGDGTAHLPTPPEVRDRDFTGVSGSFGVHADLTPASALVVNLTTATRAPSLEELYNFGPHLGNAAFEIGNPDLEVERTIGLDLSLRRRGARASGEINVFTYAIRNFVFSDFTGEVIDGLREADVMQGNSRFVGAEASGSVELGGHVHATVGASLVRATLTDTDQPLPRIPPFSARFELEVPFRGITVTPEVVLNAAQRRVFTGETPTDGYALLNLSATYFIVRAHATHSVTFKAHNLTNEAYRLHTSFLKALAPEAGRGVKLSYTVRFF